MNHAFKADTIHGIKTICGMLKTHPSGIEIYPSRDSRVDCPECLEGRKQALEVKQHATSNGVTCFEMGWNR